MKSLLIIRHAKSDWGSPYEKDFDRKLNDRGKRDAPEMAKRLLKKDIKIDSIAVFGHNPGATSFVNLLTGTQVDNMPTCAVFAVKAAIKHWKDFEAAEKTFWFFDYPKSKD